MKYKKGDTVLEIFEDIDSENPREWDNFGKMVCYHPKYRLPNELDMDLESSDWKGYLDMKGAVIVYPLYMLDHGMQTISTNPFSCTWDSCQIGFIVATKEEISKNFGETTPEVEEKVRKILLAEVQTLDDYLRGNVYCYRTYKVSSCECCGKSSEENLDSCCGFYGDNFEENGLFESAGVKDINEWEEIE
jgi:hypothetical protein